ncbi:MAG: CRTAC1 family protein [Pirellulales bacterium]
MLTPVRAVSRLVRFATCLTVALLIASPAGVYGQPTFTDVTLSAGVDYQQWTPASGDREMFRMTGGAAAGDVDGDGYPDLFVTQIDGPGILFRNDRQGSFVNVGAYTGIAPNVATNGAALGDIDNDGDLDLYLTAVEGNRHFLYVNDGSGHFTDETSTRGAGIETKLPHFGTSAAFGDYDNDGLLDLHVNEWGTGEFKQPPELWSHARVLHNRGPDVPGHFEDATLETGIYLDDFVGADLVKDVPGVYSFTSTFADFDRDGHVDLAIAGDFLTSQLFWNNGDNSFTKAPRPYQDNPAGIGTDENGMGSAIADFNGDGLLDWFVTSIDDELSLCPQARCTWGESGNRLYLNNGDRTFSDVTDQYGVRDGDWGWGAAFFDYDNDGDLDLTMTNGWTGNGPSEQFVNDPMKLWRNDGDTYTEVAAAEGLLDDGAGKGLLTLDYDLDGDLDLFVVNNAGSPKLFRNETNSQGAFLTLEAEGVVSNRDGIGAFVTLIADQGGPSQTRYIAGGSNYLSQSDLTVHFGLGIRTVPIHQIVIEWPSGIEQILHDIPVNSRLHILEAVPEPMVVELLCVGIAVSSCLRPLRYHR